MSKRRVVVTGLGIVSPVGSDVATAWSCDSRGQERHQADHANRRDSVRHEVRGRSGGLRRRRLHLAQGSAAHGSVHALRHGRGHPGGGGFGSRLRQGKRRSLWRHHGLRHRRSRGHRRRSDHLGTDSQPEEDLAVLHPEHHRQHGRGPPERSASGCAVRTSAWSARARRPRMPSASRCAASSTATRTSSSPVAPSAPPRRRRWPASARRRRCPSATTIRRAPAVPGTRIATASSWVTAAAR